MTKKLYDVILLDKEFQMLRNYWPMAKDRDEAVKWAKKMLEDEGLLFKKVISATRAGA